MSRNNLSVDDVIAEVQSRRERERAKAAEAQKASEEAAAEAAQTAQEAASEVPEIPEVPEVPDVPEIPETPQIPESPVSQEEPELPAQPQPEPEAEAQPEPADLPTPEAEPELPAQEESPYAEDQEEEPPEDSEEEEPEEEFEEESSEEKPKKKGYEKAAWSLFSRLFSTKDSEYEDDLEEKPEEEEPEETEEFPESPEEFPGTAGEEPSVSGESPDFFGETQQPYPAAQAEGAPASEEITYAPAGIPQHFIRNDAFPRLFREEAAYYTAKNQEEAEETPEDVSIYESSLDTLDFDLEEYDAPDKKQDVGLSIQKKQREVTLSLAFSGVCALAALIFVIAGHFGLEPQRYALVYLGLTVIAAAANLRGFISGITGLFTLRGTHDSAVALASCAAVIQCVTVFFDPDSFLHGSLFLYAPLVVCAWFLNAFGRLSALRRISRNFQFLTSSERKYAVDLIEDNADCVKIAGNYIERQPLVAFQKRADFYDHFIYNSSKADPSRFIVQMVAPMGLIASLILFAASFILFRNAVAAVTAFTASACIFIPIAGLLCVNLPVGVLSSLARKWGGMICGYASVEKFARTNIVLIDAEDLFPRGSTQLVNVQTFSGSDPQKSVLCAASLIRCFEGPLTEIFDQALRNLELSPVRIESPQIEESLGLSGWADGAHILVGNRKLMSKYSVALPPKEVERPYISKGQQLLYISLGGVISAMLILSYKGDSRRAAELGRLEKNGYLIVVHTCDVNITPGLISARFGIDGRNVRILPEKLGSIYDQNVDAAADRADSLILTKGRTTTMFRLLTACSVQKSNITFALILQSIAIALGFIFVAFITCYSGLEQLKTGALLLYELFWLAAIIIVPKLRRP